MHIKEAMKVILQPSTYQELWDLATQIDQRHWEYESETRWTQIHTNLTNPCPLIQQSGYKNFQTTLWPPPTTGNNPPMPRPVTGTPATLSQPTNQPQQLNNPSYVPLSDEEWEWWCKENLCLRCGKPGHFSAACPDRWVVRRAIFTLDEGEGDLQEGYEITEDIEEDVGNPDEELNEEVA